MLRAFFLAGLLVAVGAAELPDDWACDLTLNAALHSGSGEHSERPLYCLLRRRDGRWQSVVGFAQRFNSGYHTGLVRSASIADDRLVIELAMDIASDPWVPGGQCRYRIEATRTADGDWQASHSGRFRFRPVAGRVQVLVHPPVSPSQPPVGPGEHPRLLLRREDLPALQAKAATAFGQAALARLTDAGGLGLRHLLTGDAADAAAARQLVEEIMAEESSGSKSVAHRVWSWRAEAIALAYDHCYDAWEPGFRKEVQDYLTAVMERHFFNHGSFTEYIKWTLTSRFTGNLLAGPILAGLALRGEPGPVPPQPAAYLGGRDPQEPLPLYREAPEAAVAAFADDALPTTWLFAGGIESDRGAEPLAAAGLPEAPVTSATAIAGKPCGALGEKAFWNGNIDITGANDRVYYSWNYFATTVDNDTERWVRYAAGLSGGIDGHLAFLNGVPLSDGDVFRLPVGRSQLLVGVHITETNPWGKIFMRPRLQELEAATAIERLAVLLENAADRQAMWAADAAFHAASGGADPRLQRLYEIGAGCLYAIYRHAIGTGGFQYGAVDSCFQLQRVIRCAYPFRVANGRDLSPFCDVGCYLPRKLFPVIERPDGVLVQGINGKPGFAIHEWFDKRDGTSDFFACLYPLVPEGLQPAVLGQWRQRLSVDESDHSAVLQGLQGMGHEVDFAPLNTHAAYAFVTYPPEAAAEPLADGMPRSWYAPDTGYLALRNGFDTDATVVQVYAKQRSSPDWESENAGALRIAGLGEEWFLGSRQHQSARRLDSLPVLLTEDGGNDRGCGLVTVVTHDAAGGRISIDLDDVYSSVIRNVKGDPLPLYAGYGQMRFADRAVGDVGGHRSVAVDWGDGTQPPLIAICDRIDGAPARWQWQLESRSESYGKWTIVDPDGKTLTKGKQIKKARVKGQPRTVLKPGYQYVIHKHEDVSEEFERREPGTITIAGNAFTVQRGDASMQLTMAPAPGLELQQRTAVELRKQLSGHGHGVSRIGSIRVEATGSPVYFCILTLQRGEAPPVTIEGSGAEAVFTVAGRQVRFDGNDIVITPVP